MSEVVTEQSIVVVGAGIAGISAALEAAEVGKDVILIEQRPFVGGRTTQLYQYFPKLCDPTCGLEINQGRLRSRHKNLKIMTMSTVESITGEIGNYKLRVKTLPRYVNEHCTACGECGKVVKAEFEDEFNYGLSKRGGAYLPHNMAYPQRYVLDPRIIGTDDAIQVKEACQYGAIDLEMQERVFTLSAGAVILATGWRPYDAQKIQPYGYGRYPNVVTNVEFERFLDKLGPTGGKILRPSDGKEAKRVAFIQCAGSRDENHLRHCSRICCMASLKEATFVEEQYGEGAEVDIYYIDMRIIDRFEGFYQQVKSKKCVNFIKSKVAKVVQDKENFDPILHGVDIEGYKRYSKSYDLVVLAVGMEPALSASLGKGLSVNREGFVENKCGDGVIATGCAVEALDVNRVVQGACASALRALQVVNKIGGKTGGGVA